MTHVITTYGGGEVFELVFNAVAMLVKKDGNFLSPMTHLVLSIGALYAATVMFFKNDLRDGAWWMLWALTATAFLTSSTMRVEIYDPLANKRYSVDNVPFVLGVVASKVSQVGRIVTEEMEAKFSLPDSAAFKYHKTGTVFASALMSQVKNFRITDPEMKSNMHEFVNQCVVLPAMLGTKFTMTDLQNSQDIWGLLKQRASPLLHFLYKEGTAAAKFLTCREGAQKLETRWTQEIASAKLLYGQRVNGRTLKKTEFDTYLTSSFDFMGGIAAAADDILRQEMMINAIDEAANNKLSELGSAANYASTKALLQQRSTYAIAGDIAAKTLPLFKNVIEALAYALFVFVVVLAMLPNGWRILMNYFGILVWTQLWAPLYAVLNLIMTLYGKHETLGYAGERGLTMLTSSAIYSANEDMTTLAAWLSVSIPFLSWGILKQGAGAFVGMAQSLSSAMQSASSGVAAETVSGNLSSGNVSVGTRALQNVSAFQHNTSPYYSSGQMRSLDSTGMEVATQADGSTSFASQNVSQVPSQIMATRDESMAFQKQISEAQSMAQNDNIAARNAVETSYTQNMNAAAQIGKLYQEGADYTRGQQTSQNQSFQKVQNAMNELRDHYGFSSGQAFEAMMGASLGLPAGMPVGANVGGNFSSQASRDEAISKAQAYMESRGSHVSVDDLQSFNKTVSEHSGRQEDKNLAESAAASYSQAQSLTHQAEVSYSRLKSLQESQTSTQQRGISHSEDVTQKVIDLMTAEVGAAEAQKIIAGGMPAMSPWADKFFALNPEYKPMAIDMNSQRQQLQSDYQSQGSLLERGHTPQLGGGFEKAQGQVIDFSKSHGLDPQQFKMERTLQGEVETAQASHRQDIQNETAPIQATQKQLQDDYDASTQHSLAGKVAENTFGVKIEEPQGEKPAFVLDKENPAHQEAYNRNVGEIMAYKNVGGIPSRGSLAGHPHSSPSQSSDSKVANKDFPKRS